MSDDGFRSPPWLGHGVNVVPGTAGLALPLGVRDDGAASAWLTGFAATPEGVHLTVTVAREPGRGNPLRGEDGLRVGVRLADGREATLDVDAGLTDAEPVAGVALNSRGGGGDDRRWDWDVWLWPLPPAGDVTFTSSWGDDVVIDAAPLRAAAGRAIELWPDERPYRPAPEPRDAEDGAGWLAYAPVDVRGPYDGPRMAPGAVGAAPVLLQTASVAAWLSDLEATPDGLALAVNVAWRVAPGQDDDEVMVDLPFALRVELADGRVAHADDWSTWAVEPDDDAVVLRFSGGEGWGLGLRRRGQLQPLPPDGPLRFVASWPEEGVEEAVVEIDAALVREAAGRAVTLWPDDDGEGPAA